MEVFVFLIALILIWYLIWFIYRTLLNKCENAKFQWIRLCIWLPLHEWNLLWEYLSTNECAGPYGALVLPYSWIEKKMFKAGWYDYLAKIQSPILNSFISLSYECELLVDNVNVLGSPDNSSCDVIYNNENTTLEEYNDCFVLGAYVTSSQPIKVPNFLKLMQSVLAQKYNDFQFQTIESDINQKQTILFRKRIAKEGDYTIYHWQAKYNLLEILSSFSPVREDCVRIFNLRADALNGPSNGESTGVKLLENMLKITG